jgi:hypothetical protein
MDWEIASDRAERAVDAGAAAAFAAAIGFAVRAAGTDGGPAIVAASAIAFLLAFAALRRMPPDEQTFALPVFELPAFEPAPGSEVPELLLDDRLAEIPADARVVRLFDPARARGGEAPDASESSDAAQALSDALAGLRRSLR